MCLSWARYFLIAPVFERLHVSVQHQEGRYETKTLLLYKVTHQYAEIQCLGIRTKYLKKMKRCCEICYYIFFIFIEICIKNEPCFVRAIPDLIIIVFEIFDIEFFLVVLVIANSNLTNFWLGMLAKANFLNLSAKTYLTFTG